MEWLRLIWRYRRVVKALIRVYRTMDYALSDDYVTREEAAKIGYAMEHIYREAHKLAPRRD